MSSAGSAERDARDLDRGLLVNLVGYLLKLGQPALLIWVVRSYGAEGWGQYTVSEAVVMVALRVILMGFDKTYLWWVPRMGEDPHALAKMRGAMFAAVGLAVIAALAIATTLAAPLAAWRGDEAASGALQWMAWSLLPMTVMELFIAAALGKRRVESQVLVRDGLVAMSFVVLALLCFYAGLETRGLSVAHFAANALGAIASGVIYVRLYGFAGLWGRPRLPDATVIRYTLGTWGTELVASSAQRMDVLAVSYWGTPAAVGVYGVVVRVGNAVRSVRRSYDPIVTTLMSDIAMSRDMARLKAAFSRATVLVMLTQTPIFAGLACFADVLMPMFGVQFTDAVVPVLVICGFWLLNGAFGLNALIVNGFGRSDLILVDLIFSTALQAGLLYLLVPDYGAVGASIAVGTGYLATNLIQVAQGTQLSGINPYNRSTVDAAAAATIALVAGALSLWLGHAYLEAWTARIIAVLVFIAVLLPMALPIVRRTLQTARVEQ